MASFARTGQPPGRVAAPPNGGLPPGFALVPDRQLRILRGGRVLQGGSPLALVRLRPRATEMVGRWLDGATVGQRRPERMVARRLVSLGLFHPRPPTDLVRPPVTVVIPVRDRVGTLERLLTSLGDAPCMVVDDASEAGGDVEKCARNAGAEYLRLERRSGPAAARNAGLARAETPLVAFVDSDCTVPDEWLEPLVAHFADPRVALVAPRVVSRPGPSALARYESARSPLDMGPDEGRVAPGTRIPYVPTAAVIVRRESVIGKAFDEDLGAGEDVDLVWRLVDAGWEIRFEPFVHVVHESDLRPHAWLSRRAVYGTTAGPLSRRHPDALAPARIPPALAAAATLAGVGRPVSALAVGVSSAAALATRLAGAVEDPLPEALQWAFVGTARGIPPAVVGLTRAWAPALAASLCVRRLGRLRRVAAAALLATAARGWRRARLDPVRHCTLGLADDLAYGAGVWWGCWRSRTLRPLTPAIGTGRRSLSGRIRRRR